MALTSKVLLIGWDAADWRVITPLLDAGLMPALESLIDRGVMGNISTLNPPLSPLLWTSIATGKTADKHGVLGFTQPREDGTGIRPVLSTSRQVKALWNILGQSGLRSNVIGWWPSHPAEPIRGVMASNFFPKLAGTPEEPTPLSVDAIHPPALAETFSQLRVHPSELTSAHVVPFVPFYAERGMQDLDTYEENAINSIVRSTAEAASIQSAATWAMENTEWTLTAAYFDFIDHIGHNFMSFHPPQLPGVPDDRFERFQHVMTATYRFQDMMLDRMLTLAGEETTVIVLSDHGFHADHLRSVHRSDDPAGPAMEHRSLGIFVAAGPGIQKDERVYGASLLDVAPTILTLLGLPVGEDMDGRVLTPIFDREVTVERVPSWEDIEGEDGMHTEDSFSDDPWTEQVAMDQLIALGYVDPVEGEAADAVRISRQESRYYLAQVYLGKDRPDLAAPILEALWNEEPARRFGFELIRAYQALRRFEEAHAVLDHIEAEKRENALATIPEETRNRIPEDATPVFPGLDLKRGGLLIAEGRYAEALPLLERAEQGNPRSPSLPRQIGEAYLAASQFDKAETALRRSLEIEPEQPRALMYLGQVLFAKGEHEAAASEALTAIGLRFFFPAAHALLGDTLARLGHLERAAEAYQVALSQRPSHARARFALADVYRRLDRHVEAVEILSGENEASGVPVIAQRPEDRESRPATDST